MYDDYARRITVAQAEGRVTTRYSAPMILGLIRSLVLTWQLQAGELGSRMPESTEERRATIVTAIRVLLGDAPSAPRAL
jgi:hypothetical protein